MNTVLRYVVSGEAFLLCAVQENGQCEVRQFLDDLERHGNRHRKPLWALLKRIALAGIPSNKQLFEWVGTGKNPRVIGEIKNHEGGLRLFGFAHATRSATIVLTHGWAKAKAPGQRRGLRVQQSQQIAKAEEALRRHQADPVETIIGEDDDG